MKHEPTTEEVCVHADGYKADGLCCKLHIEEALKLMN